VGFGVGVGVGVGVRVIMISVGPCQGLLYTGAYLQCGASHVEHLFQLILKARHRCMYVEGGGAQPLCQPPAAPCQDPYPPHAMHRQTHPTHGCTCRPSLLSTQSSTLNPTLTPTPTPIAGTTRQTSIGRVVPASKVGVGVGFGVGVGVGVGVRVIMISVGPCQGLLYTGAYLQCGASHVEQPFQLILEAWYRCAYVEGGGAQLLCQLPAAPCQDPYPALAMNRQTHPTHGCTCRPSLLSTQSCTLNPTLTPTPLAGTARRTSIGRVVPASKVGVGVGVGFGVEVGVIMISVGPCQGLLYTGAYL
jgi:hypothetical protein